MLFPAHVVPPANARHIKLKRNVRSRCVTYCAATSTAFGWVGWRRGTAWRRCWGVWGEGLQERRLPREATLRQRGAERHPTLQRDKQHIVCEEAYKQSSVLIFLLVRWAGSGPGPGRMPGTPDMHDGVVRGLRGWLGGDIAAACIICAWLAATAA